MSSSNSSTPKSPKLIVAMDDSKEKETENNHMKQGSLHEVMSERGTNQNPPFISGVVGTERDILKMYPSKSNKIFTCQFCNKRFSKFQALGGHQNAHKHERELEKKQKEMEAEYPGLGFLNLYLDKPHLLYGGYSQDSLSNENHLGITLKPISNRSYTSFNSGVARGITDMVPCVTPTGFFTGKTRTDGSCSSKGHGPLSAYNNNNPLVSKNAPPFALPPPQTKNITSGFCPRGNVLREEDFISKIGKNNIVKIDDDDDESEEEKSKNLDINLSLCL